MAHVPRIHVPGHITPGPLTLGGEQGKRLATVMRVREGDGLLLFSGDGHEWRAVVENASRGSVRVTVSEVARHEPAPTVTVELWCALVRPNRFDWALEKATEAGVDVIRPLICEFAARGETASSSRRERWERIVVEASEQCGRLRLPVVAEPIGFEAALERLHAAIVVAQPGGRTWSETAALLPREGTVVIAIGPEAGFSDVELAKARSQGALETSLGPNILRTETAAVVAVALARSR